MARVYLALMAGPAGFSKLLVIKILREDLLAGSAESVQMFWEEARIAARLSHPNIVQTHEVGEIAGRYFIAMEYLDGQPYSALLSKARRALISLPEHLRILSEIARALHYAHHLRSYQGDAIGVVHRDVSPHNIFVTYDGQAKLLDFGVATTEDGEHVTRVGVIKGKLDYIAPEQLRGDQVDGRADVFSLGAVLWEMLSGQRFAGGRKVSDVNKVQTRLSGGEKKIREVMPSIAPELERIVDRALSTDPLLRQRDACELADALDAYTASLGALPGPKTLGPVLQRMFEAERSEMHALIDEQLQSVKQANLAMDSGDSTSSLPNIQRQQAEDDSSMFVAEAHGHSMAPGQSKLERRTVALSSSAARPSLKPNKREMMALVGAGVVLAGACIAWLIPSGPKTVPLGESAPQSAPAAAASTSGLPNTNDPAQLGRPDAPPPANSVILQIRITPSHATVTVDGVPVTTPFTAQFRKDPSMHRIEASADGYRGSKQFVTFERDQALVLALERIVTQSPRRPAASEARRQEAASERREERRELTRELILPEAGPPAAAPKVVAPGADIDIPAAPAASDDIYQANPYRN